ncbi:MAG: hypothetical protein M1831_002970 [Alyxoria varia]|nr:MAG: hypothetical protein M1831_002970 [Alyxoria varia]
MTDRNKAPYVPQDVKQVSRILEAMESHAHKGKKAGGFSCRKKTYQVAKDSDRTVDSWSMNDWDYKKPNLPTYARGLFTHRNTNNQPEIAIRGYDKFFNVDEVNKTRWRNVENNTRGPYELSVKENGCIIFIAGLDDQTLLITSKHSTGPRTDNSANHAAAGEAWIEKQLAAIGRTKADMARKLRSMNATAVAELCDDEFEEHVLRYDPDTAGLYLHGINLNLPEFATYPGNLVNKFGEEWGFKKTTYVLEDDINKVKSFLDKIAETGNFEGRNTEGFVIRCQARDSPDAPYHDWFFKYKFDEPYLMYRQWREVTKSIIAGKPPRYRKHKQITSEYITYARRQLAQNPQLGPLFNKNHGIIAMRDGFLQEKGLKGSDIIQSELQAGLESDPSQVTKDVVLVPVATIGCGKTTVAVALTKLFNWGHQQNDNIEGKNRPARFASACVNSLSDHKAMIADRNNHQRREREQLMQDVRHQIPDAKFVALHYVHDRGSYDEIRNAMRERVFSRGDNHQTIHVETKGTKAIEGIMEGFLDRFEPVNSEKPPDDDFDLIIDLDPTVSSRENLATVVSVLDSNLPKLFDTPTDDALNDAIEWAMTNYSIDKKHEIGGSSKKQKTENKSNKRPAKQQGKEKPAAVEFFGIFVPADRVKAILEALFKAQQDPETRAFYDKLNTTGRIQDTFHVTLLHRAQSKEHADYWHRLSNAHSLSHESGSTGIGESWANGATSAGFSNEGKFSSAKVRLERVVWDGRAMTVVARLPEVKGGTDGEGWPSVNPIAHATVGTRDPSVKPKESNDVLQRWESGDGNVKDLKIPGQVVLDGAVKAVLSRR